MGRAFPAPIRRDTRARELELMLFEHRADAAREAAQYGIGSFLVDWEQRGKESRQSGYDTQIDPGTVEDLAGIVAIPGAKAWCRINSFGPTTKEEIEAAAGAGAAGIFLPMVASVPDVVRFIEWIDGRCQAGILVETVQAVGLAADLARLPLDRVYFGLNDYAISRGRRFIFEAVLDGTVARVRQAMSGLRFGWGGATAVERGEPVPCRLLLSEMARLDCDFTFLRRSFRRDVAFRHPAEIVVGLRRYWKFLVNRSADAVAVDHRSLTTLLADLCETASGT